MAFGQKDSFSSFISPTYNSNILMQFNKIRSITWGVIYELAEMQR